MTQRFVSLPGFAWLATALIAFAAFAVPDVPPFGTYEGTAFSPTVTVLEANADRVRLHFEMENLPSGPINLNQKQPGTWGQMNQIDQANPHMLPRITFFVAIPPTGNPTRVIEEWNSVELAVSQGINLSENNPRPDSVVLGDISVIGGVRVVALTIRPISYQNGGTVCRALNTGTISIELDDAEGQNSVPANHRRSAFSRTWQKVYQATIINWETIANFYTATNSHILLIVPNTYEAQLANFIRWKEERGIKCTVVLRNSIGNNPTDSQIRSRIIQELETSIANGPAIDYVILVGDETQLTPNGVFTADPVTRFSEESYSGTFTNEGYFCMVEGGDYVPDLFLGRWVVNSAQEVQTIVNRTIQHERDTFIGDSLRFEKAFVAADYTEATQRSTKRRVARMLAAHGFENVDSLWGQGFNTPPEIFPAAVNGGLALFNYRGSGWDTWWYGINFHNFMVEEDINDQRMLPIITGIGCGVGIFNGPDNNGLGESWMIAGSPTNPKGAVGFIGPCWNTHTVFNDCLDSSIYRGFLDWDVQNLSAALTCGKIQLWGVFNIFLNDNDVYEVAKTAMRQYHCESDPSLQVFTDTPLRLNVTHLPTVPNVPVNFTVGINNMIQVEAESLCVTMRIGPGNFVSRWIEPTEANITLPVDVGDAQYAILTVTGDNILAFRDSIPVAPDGPYLVHDHATLTETVGNNDLELNPGETINWLETALNGGNQTAIGIQSQLTSSSTGITISQADAAFADIAPGQSAAANSPYTVTISNENLQPRDLNFNIHWTVSNGQPRTSPVTMTVHVPQIATVQTSFNDGDGDGEWERYETAEIRVSFQNDGNGDLAAGTYTITTEDPYVIPVQPSFDAPQVNRGQNYSFPANSFRFTADGQTPANRTAHFVLTGQINQGTYTYPISFPFDLLLERESAHDPFTDDEGRYWVYDNSDTEYRNLPVYQWQEIDPQYGGPGAQFTFVNQSDIQSTVVPFNFNWYDQTFNTLSVGATGWARPGTADSASADNVPLPAQTRPSGLIAVMWDDIWRPNTETGHVCYYFDVTADKFIIEWSRLHYRFNSFQGTETFQLQLLNPATYPTQSGNAKWVLLFSEVSNRAVGPTGCTVGMESPNQQHGFTYVCNRTYDPGAAPLELGRAIMISTDPPQLLGMPERERPQVPSQLMLSQNFPNPFNPTTSITFGVPGATNVTLEIFDMLGRNVATLFDGRAEAGVHSVTWLAANVPTGLYIYRLTTPTQSLSRKMLLMK